MTRASPGGPPRLAVVTSHPIQYQAPWFRGLAKHCDLRVFFAHRQSAREQADAGFGVAFDWDVDLTSGYAHEYLDNVSRSPNVYAFGGCDTPQIHARLAAGRFDAVVVTGWYLKCYAQTVLAARRLGLPVLVRGDSRLGTPRPAWRRALKQPVYRVGLRAFSAFLSVGRLHTEYLRHYGVPESRIFFAPHFVDAEHFAAPFAHGSPEHATARRELGIAPGASLALFVGRLLEFKRPLDVVRALGLLRRRGIRAELAIAGDGPLASAIEREATREGVVVHQLGFRNQRALPALYACADALALPSDANETWGLVVNEAMSCGVPAVVSDQVGCAPDLIAQGQTGYVHPLGDIPRLADALSFAFDLRRRPETSVTLASKMHTYGCQSAVAGTLTALQSVARRLP